MHHESCHVHILYSHAHINIYQQRCGHTPGDQAWPCRLRILHLDAATTAPHYTQVEPLLSHHRTAQPPHKQLASRSHCLCKSRPSALPEDSSDALSPQVDVPRLALVSTASNEQQARHTMLTTYLPLGTGYRPSASASYGRLPPQRPSAELRCAVSYPRACTHRHHRCPPRPRACWPPPSGSSPACIHRRHRRRRPPPLWPPPPL